MFTHLDDPAPPPLSEPRRRAITAPITTSAAEMYGALRVNQIVQKQR